MGDQEPVLTTPTIYELFLRKHSLNPIENLVKNLSTLEFDETSARIASQITKDLVKKGKMSQVMDIFIVAICIKNNTVLLTSNKKHYENIKGLKLIWPLQ